MFQYILKINGQVVPQRSLKRLTDEKIRSEPKKSKQDEFNNKIKDLSEDSMHIKIEDSRT